MTPAAATANAVAPDTLHSCAGCPSLPWGQSWELGSASFWAELAASQVPQSPALTDSLEAALVACMLGGYGVPGDVGVASFAAVRSSGLLQDTTLGEDELAEALRTTLAEPITVPGRRVPVRYRFHQQRP